MADLSIVKSEPLPDLHIVSTEPRTFLDSVADAGSKFWDWTGKPVAYAMGMGPGGRGGAAQAAAQKQIVDGIMNEPARVRTELTNALDAFTAGNPRATLHHTLNAIPMLGAGINQVAQEANAGDYSSAAGHLGALVAPAVAGPALDAVGDAAGAARTAIANTAERAATSPVVRAGLKVLPKGPAMVQLVDAIRDARNPPPTGAGYLETAGTIQDPAFVPPAPAAARAAPQWTQPLPEKLPWDMTREEFGRWQLAEQAKGNQVAAAQSPAAAEVSRTLPSGRSIPTAEEIAARNAGPPGTASSPSQASAVLPPPAVDPLLDQLAQKSGFKSYAEAPSAFQDAFRNMAEAERNPAIPQAPGPGFVASGIRGKTTTEIIQDELAAKRAAASAPATPAVTAPAMPKAELFSNPAQGGLLDEDNVATLMKAIKEKANLPPIVAREGGQLIGGHHRLEAFQRLGIEPSPAPVYVPESEYQQLRAEGEPLDEIEYQYQKAWRAQPTAADRSALNRGLHAVAAKLKISHDALSDIVGISHGVKSMKDLSFDQMREVYKNLTGMNWEDWGSQFRAPAEGARPVFTRDSFPAATKPAAPPYSLAQQIKDELAAKQK